MSALALALALAAPACGYFLRSPGRPTPSLYYHWGGAEARASCLLVLIPGFLDDPDAFEREGVIEQLHDAAPSCDLVATSVHLYDYRDESVVDRVHEDLVLEARRRGYARVWLVGVSMGALAAVLTAREHPGDVDGLVLVSPYLGTPSFMASFEREVARHGGLSAWARATAKHEVEIARVLHDPRPVWRWLARYHTTLEDMPPLWLAFGSDDRFADAHRLLAREVEPERRFVVEGRHDWRTWRRVLQDVVAELPVERGEREVDALAPSPSARIATRRIERGW